MRRSPALAWALLLPALAPLAAFIAYPALKSLFLSLQEVEPFSRRAAYVGLENYRLLWGSPEYWHSVRVSVLFTLYTVVPSMIISLGLALALDANPFFSGLLRTIFVMPVAISSAMAAMLWIFIYNPTAGYLNYLLELARVAGPNWLGDPKWALAAVAIATVWRELGFNVVFFLAGLASVPPELKEAATIDGAGPLQRLRHVILPILSPTIFFVAVVSVVNSFQSFGQIRILTDGGPAGETDILVYNLYRDAFVNFRTGYASAQSVILFLLLLAATAAQFRLAKRRVHYD